MSINALNSLNNVPALPPILKESSIAVPVLEEFSYSSKLTNVEAQRIMAVLQEIQKKVNILGLIPSTIDKRFSTVFNSNITTVVKDLVQLEAKHKTLLSEDDKDVLNEVESAIKVQSRAVCRYFMQNQDALIKLKYLKTIKTPAIAQFEHRLQEIKMLIYERLRTTVEEENQNQDQLSLIIAKEQKTSGEVKLLKVELEKAKKERQGEINKKNEIIRKLKDELKDIKTQAEEVTRKLETRSKMKEEQDLKSFKERESEILAEIQQLKDAFERKTLENREEESAARKKKFKIESEVENWILKYDQDLEEKQAEIDDITTLFLEEKSHLDELQGQYSELQKEYAEIQARQKEIEEKKKLQELEMARLGEAATLIQKIFRGYRVRLEIWRKKVFSNSKKNEKKVDKKGKKKK